MRLKGKKVTVVGLGNSGMNAAVLLDDQGADVFVTDAKDGAGIRNNLKAFKGRSIKLEIGGHTEDFIRKSSLVVVSPGVEDSSLPVRWAERHNVPVMGEMELGYRYCKGKIIAITGTNGKSTVTTLIGEILKDASLDTAVCGNIGNSLCGEIGRINNNTFVVLEVSSFQLERIEGFRPHIAVLLNITDDHLDRYRTFDDYYKEKLKIFKNQDKDDILILNHDAANLRPIKDMARSKVLFYSRERRVDAYVKDGDLVCSSVKGKEGKVCSVRDIRLKGIHNLENVLASCLVGVLAGAGKDSIRKTIRSFKGLSHRVETVAVINGVEYIDDSKGTTVDSTRRALESCDKPVILIAGGRDKNSDYAAIRDLVRRRTEAVILIGEAKKRIAKVLEGAASIYMQETVDGAVRLASEIAMPGMVVLLSPMCSSFDMFKDYKERGDVFKESVRRIREMSEVPASRR